MIIRPDYSNYFQTISNTRHRAPETDNENSSLFCGNHKFQNTFYKFSGWFKIGTIFDIQSINFE